MFSINKIYYSKKPFKKLYKFIFVEKTKKNTTILNGDSNKLPKHHALKADGIYFKDNKGIISEGSEICSNSHVPNDRLPKVLVGKNILPTNNNRVNTTSAIGKPRCFVPKNTQLDIKEKTFKNNLHLQNTKEQLINAQKFDLYNIETGEYGKEVIETETQVFDNVKDTPEIEITDGSTIF